MEEKSPIPERTVPSAEWKIQKRSRLCTACQRPFSDGERYHSALRFGGEHFLRSDYCCGCWTAPGKDDRGIFSFWQGKFLMDEPPRKQEAIESTRAENLLARLVQSTEPGNLKLAYVFALLLERKRKLAFKGRSDRDGRTYVIYEHPRTGRAYMVEDMNIDLREAESIQESLNNVLAGEETERADDQNPLSGSDDGKESSAGI